MLRPRDSHPGIHKRPHGNLFRTHEDEKCCKCSQLYNDCEKNPSDSHSLKVQLIRSLSFPPQERYRTRYVLKICEIPKDSEEPDGCASSLRSDLNSLSSYNVMDSSSILSQAGAPIIVEKLIDNVSMKEPNIENLTPISLGEISMRSGTHGCSVDPVKSALHDAIDPVKQSALHDAINPMKAALHDVIDPMKTAINDVIEPMKSVSHHDIETSSGVSPLALDMADISPINPDSNPPFTLPASSSPVNSTDFSEMPRSGKLLFCGRRREMEDTASIVTPFMSLQCTVAGDCISETELPHGAPLHLHFFAIYDGHGGAQASNYCMERFHGLLAEELENIFGAGNSLLVEFNDECNKKWDEVMKATFLKMDKEVGGVCPNGFRDEDDMMDTGCSCCVDAIAPENVGTTAVVAIIGTNQIIVANCGDSRAVLARENSAIPMSRDHKPEIEEETRRIEDAGGRVIRWDGYRVGGLLALSRAIGDRYLKRYVISEPEVKCIERMPGDECLILASDGLWDVIDNDLACEVARKCLSSLRKKYKSRPSLPGEDHAAGTAAALLVKLAYARGSKDNISVVVVDLKARSSG